MSEEPEDSVQKDEEVVSETSDTATTAEAPVPTEEPSAEPDAADPEPEEAPVAEDAADPEPEEAPVAEEAADPEPEEDAVAEEAAEEQDAESQAAPPESSPPPPAVEPGPVGSPEALGKADVGKRIVAALIDFAIAFVVGLVPGVGQLLGAAYLILRDGLELDFMNHRSLGKQVMKLHLESVDGQPLELITSVKRNWIFAIGPLVPLLIVIPILGWVMIPFAIFAALALGITELVLALTDADGRRLGDKWAGTMVVED